MNEYDSLSIHYQFHESQGDPKTDPIATVRAPLFASVFRFRSPAPLEQWHQGGPGGSSIDVGLYTEMGYFQVDSEGTHTNDYVRAARSPPAAFARRSNRGACAGVEQSREHAVPRVSGRLRLSQRLLHLRQGRARRRLRVDRPVPGRGLRPHPRLFLRAGERVTLLISRSLANRGSVAGSSRSTRPTSCTSRARATPGSTCRTSHTSS